MLLVDCYLLKNEVMINWPGITRCISIPFDQSILLNFIKLQSLINNDYTIILWPPPKKQVEIKIETQTDKTKNSTD